MLRAAAGGPDGRARRMEAGGRRERRGSGSQRGTQQVITGFEEGGKGL